MFDYVTDYNYQQAIDYISQFKMVDKKLENKQAIELFCKQNLDESSITKTKEITVLSLLKKGNGLSDNGHKYLLQALDPDFNSIALYIKNCINEDSKERYHYKLMQHHVNLPINDKLVVALNKFINEFKNSQNT